MKNIKIFIGSSVDKNEFELERERLGSFINGLNREYVKRGIFIDLYDCETVSNKMRAEGSQKQHDDYIENEADATFFMFFKKAGKFTLHELQVAHDALAAKNRPDIFTYFKVVGDDIEQTQEIKKAVDIIADSYGHYFSKFKDVDTIKLCMLQYIAEKLNDGSSVTICDGVFYINNIKINGIDIDNIFAYQNNGEYNRLKQEINELERQICEAVENRNFDVIESLTKRKEEDEKLFAKLESDILNMLINTQKELQNGNASPLRMKAYQLLEMGRLKEAQQIFPISTIKSRADNLKLKSEMLEQAHRELVNDAKVRIEALNLDLLNIERFELITETYTSVLENAFACLDSEFIYDYASFLEDQNNHKASYKIAKRLEGLCQLNPNKFTDFDKACLYNLLGLVCDNAKEEEDYYLKSIKIIEKLSSENPKRYSPGLATNYNNAGVFYHNQGNAEKAEAYYIKAIKIFEKLASENPERYNSDLADSYSNAGVFYDEQGNIEMAEAYHIKAIKIREKLASENPERYNPDLATSYNNMGVFYKDQGNAEKAEAYYINAVKIFEKLASGNPERYNPDLATYYSNVGVFYKDQGNAEKAEAYCIKSIKIREKLASGNPERYNSDLADSYNNAGIFYKDQGNVEKAEACFINAVKVFEKLASKNPERYNHDLAYSYNNAGIFYKDQGNAEKAEAYYINAVKIFEKLASKNPERYNPCLATIYDNAGIFYDVQGNTEKAESYYIRAIKIREKLASENPERYNPDLAVSYFNMGLFYKENKDVANAKRLLKKAYNLSKKCPYNPYCRQIVDAFEAE